MHGDLGRIRADDVVIALSQSGETEEVLRLVPALRRLECAPDRDHRAGGQLAGPGGRSVHRAGADRGGLPAGPGPVGQHDGAHGRRRCPGASGQPDARFHAPRTSPCTIPAGSLGRKLTRVEEVMRTEPAAPPGARRGDGRDPSSSGWPARADAPARCSSWTTRPCSWGSSPTATSPGCSRSAARPSWTGRSATVMTPDPYRIRVGATLADAVEMMKAHKISELPVVDRGDRLVGLIDVTDLIGLAARGLRGVTGHGCNRHAGRSGRAVRSRSSC